jgi:hypothetical protein
MSLTKVRLIAGCVILVALCLVFSRDWLLEKGGTPDLRNRIVGARLQKDGKAPYFYRWHNGDTIRYYDFSNFGTGVSNISSSPFLHTLLYPIVDLPQRTISKIWLFIEYLLLIITGLFAFRLAKNNIQTILVAAAFLLFLLTEAWRNHIILGQIYILIPFLAMLFYYCLTRSNNQVAAFVAGVTAITLLLIRPNSIVFFAPFLFLVTTYSRKYLIIFLIPIILLPAIYFSFENNRVFWKQYPTAIQESIKVHQQLNKQDTAHPKVTTVALKDWEGWKSDEIERAGRSIDLTLHSEHANIFVLYQNIFHKRMPVNMMSYLSGFAIVVLLSLFFWTSKKYDLRHLPNLAILAFCLYMISDLSSPVWRHQYYTMQWLFPVFIAATVYKPTYKWLYAGLLIGLVLNIINSGFIKMEHTIGEYLILVILLYTSLSQRLEPVEPNKNSKALLPR